MTLKKIKIIYEKKNCIGAGICELVNPENFKIGKDSLANLIGGKLIDEKRKIYEKILEVDEKELEKIKMAVNGCPSRVIRIEEI